VHLNGVTAKPSRELKIGDLVTAKSGPMKRELKVLGILEKRVSAKIVDEYLEDITPETEYEKARSLKKSIMCNPFGKRGTKGRPSKKERRDLEDFFYNSENI
jgi:ribosome-associated heat shock protein Hsp15